MDKIAGLFSFKGRANRLNYWITGLLLIGLVLAGWFTGTLLSVLIHVGLSFGAWGLVLGLLVSAVAGTANTARRLHDRNKSAWWLLLFVGVPGILRFALLLLDVSDGPSSVRTGISLILLPIGIWALVELGILRGTEGPNRYGEDPLAADASNSAPAPVVS